MRAVLTTARMVSRSPTENLYLMLASMSGLYTALRSSLFQTFSDDNEFNPQVTVTTKNNSPLQLPIWDEITGKKDQKPHKYFLIHFIVFKLMKQ